MRLPKENRRKEMRFAAVQIPAKIGTLSLNGEKLDELHFITLIFGQFAVLHARSLRFLHASICKAAGGRSFIVLFLLLGGRATLLLLYFFKTKPLPWSLAAVLKSQGEIRAESMPGRPK